MPLTEPELLEVDARARALADQLRLSLGRQTWRGAAGEYQGRDVGSSLDFQDHRSYAPGDDPRHINWQAYARTGNYTMKLYREEVRPLVDLVFDATASMFAFPDKRLRSAELLSFLVHTTLQSGASCRLVFLETSGIRPVEPEAVLAHRWPALLENPARATSTSKLPLELVPFRSHSMRFFVSDLLVPGDPAPALQALSAHHGFGTLLAPFSPRESAPDWEGNYEFRDPETVTTHPRRVHERLRKRYRQAYENHFRHWDVAARKFGFLLARIDASAPLLESLRNEPLRQGILELAR